MSVVCFIFSWLLSGCVPADERAGSFRFETNGRAHETCLNQNGFQVCAWIDEFEIRRFYPKQSGSTLYRGVLVTETREIRMATGHVAEFEFTRSGPETLIGGAFADTHKQFLQDIAPDLEPLGLSETAIKAFDPQDELKFVLITDMVGQQGFVAKATCGKEVGDNVFAPDYPHPRLMLDCLQSGN